MPKEELKIHSEMLGPTTQSRNPTLNTAGFAAFAGAIAVATSARAKPPAANVDPILVV